MKYFDLLLRAGLPLLAGLGLIFAAVVASRSSKPADVAEPVSQPAAAPYEAYIAGSGLIEATSRNVEIATPVSGVVEKLFVRVGDHVEKGAPLFKIEDSDVQADVRVRESAVVSSQAKVQEAEASLEDYRQQLRNMEQVGDRRAISAEDLAKRRANVAVYTAKLAQARADLENARAELRAAEVAVERRQIRAPIAGQILQVNVREGEFAAAAVNSSPLLLIGDTRRLAVRVDIDENDAWRFRSGEPARAFLRGNRDLSSDLAFAYVEPYVRPKQSLTGSSTERVDTRVLQVVYTFDPTSIPAYVGQQVDVFIKAPALVAVIPSQAAAATDGERR